MEEGYQSITIYRNLIIRCRTTAAVEAYDIRMNKWSGLPQMAVAKSALKVLVPPPLRVFCN